MEHDDRDDIPVPTVTVNGRQWEPRSASLEAECEAIRRMAPYNRDASSEHLQRVCETHAGLMVSQIETLSADIAGDLGFPTLVSQMPIVRGQMTRVLAELAALKVMLEHFVTPEMRRADGETEVELTQACAAIELDRLQKENAALKAELAAPKGRKKAKPVDVPKPLYERMTASVNGNGHPAKPR